MIGFPEVRYTGATMVDAVGHFSEGQPLIYHWSNPTGRKEDTHHTLSAVHRPNEPCDICASGGFA